MRRDTGAVHGWQLRILIAMLRQVCGKWDEPQAVPVGQSGARGTGWQACGALDGGPSPQAGAPARGHDARRRRRPLHQTPSRKCFWVPNDGAPLGNVLPPGGARHEGAEG